MNHDIKEWSVGSMQREAFRYGVIVAVKVTVLSRDGTVTVKEFQS